MRLYYAPIRKSRTLHAEDANKGLSFHAIHRFDSNGVWNILLARYVGDFHSHVSKSAVTFVDLLILWRCGLFVDLVAFREIRLKQSGLLFQASYTGGKVETFK